MARLKGVDRFIFGRGGEECLALWTADIDYEIVPGITSGLAAAACAIVPRTYRSISQSVLFVTGHKVAEFLETHPRVAWVAYAGLPASPTTRWSGNTSRTHRQLNQEQRQSADAGDGVIRLSIGLESVDDPIANLDRALGQT